MGGAWNCGGVTTGPMTVPVLLQTAPPNPAAAVAAAAALQGQPPPAASHGRGLGLRRCDHRPYDCARAAADSIP
jgi:hypothetical protein